MRFFRTLNVASAFLAAASLLYELIFAQLLSMTLGGTVLRYAIMVGLYTFSMGVGSLCADPFLVRKFWRWHPLIVVELFLFLFATTGYVVLSSTSTQLHSLGWLEPLLYAPLIGVGFFTGFEIPILLRETSLGRSKSLVLASDYFGMLAIAFLFPLLLWPKFGIFASFLLACLMQFSGWIAFRLYASPASGPTSELGTRNKAESPTTEFPCSTRCLRALALSTSFLGIGYELLCAKIVGEYSQHEMLSQCLCMGIFLLGLGVGSFLHSRKERTALGQWTVLIKAEVTMVIIGTFAAPFFVSWATLVTLTSTQMSDGLRIFFAGSLLYTFLMGLFSGFELPILISSTHFNRSIRENEIVGLSSLGGLLSSIALSFWLFHRLGTYASFCAVAVANLCVLTLILTRSPQARSRIAGLLLCLTLAILQWTVIGVRAPLEQAFLKTHYMELRLVTLSVDEIWSYFNILQKTGTVLQVRTPYQNIDIVDDVYLKSPGFFRDFNLFINRRPQLSTDSWRSYHESFVDIVKRVAPEMSVQNVLILGGGDGILTNEVHRLWPNSHTTLIDIDPAMIRLAQSLPQLLSLNQGILNRNWAKIENADAFVWVRKTSQTFDLVLLDFPYPHDFELGKLFSKEFYASLKDRLRPQGLVVMDAPLWREVSRENIHPQEGPHIQVMINTLKAAGFLSLLPFGYVESLLVASFDRPQLRIGFGDDLSNISNSSVINLHELDIETSSSIDETHVNSIFRPRTFE